MKNRITSFLGLVLVFALFFPMGCGDRADQKASAEQEESQDTTKVMSIAPVNIDPLPGARQIVITIKDPQALLKSTSSSNIELDSEDLQYLNVQANGNSQYANKGFKMKTDSDTDTKAFLSVVETGQKAQWRMAIDTDFPDHGKYKVGIAQIEFSQGVELDKTNPNYSATIDQLQSEFNIGNYSITDAISQQGTSCQIFEKLLLSSNGPVANGIPGNPNGSSSTCIQSYAIWFVLEYRDNSQPGPPEIITRTFRLDPFIIRNP